MRNGEPCEMFSLIFVLSLKCSFRVATKAHAAVKCSSSLSAQQNRSVNSLFCWNCFIAGWHIFQCARSEKIIDKPANALIRSLLECIKPKLRRRQITWIFQPQKSFSFHRNRFHHFIVDVDVGVGIIVHSRTRSNFQRTNFNRLKNENCRRRDRRRGLWCTAERHEMKCSNEKWASSCEWATKHARQRWNFSVVETISIDFGMFRLHYGNFMCSSDEFKCI